MMDLDSAMKELSKDRCVIWLRSTEEADEFMEILDRYNITWPSQRPRAGFPEVLYSNLEIDKNKGVVIYGHTCGVPGTKLGWNRRIDHKPSNGYKQPVIPFRNIVPEEAQIVTGDIDTILDGG